MTLDFFEVIETKEVRGYALDWTVLHGGGWKKLSTAGVSLSEFENTIKEALGPDTQIKGTTEQ